MNELSVVLVGALVTCATFFVNKLSDAIANDALRTAVKAMVTLVISFALACFQLLLAGAFSWAVLWGNFPIVVASAMTFYGLILKPATKL
jgi:hypothetical protein